MEAIVEVGDGVTEGLRALGAVRSIEHLAFALPVGPGAEGEFCPPAAVSLQLGRSAFAFRAAGRSHLLLSQVRNSGDPQLRYGILAEGLADGLNVIDGKGASSRSRVAM
jgi:hypothetical protein